MPAGVRHCGMLQSSPRRLTPSLRHMSVSGHHCGEVLSGSMERELASYLYNYNNLTEYLYAVNIYNNLTHISSNMTSFLYIVKLYHSYMIYHTYIVAGHHFYIE